MNFEFINIYILIHKSKFLNIDILDSFIPSLLVVWASLSLPWDLALKVNKPGMSYDWSI